MASKPGKTNIFSILYCCYWIRDPGRKKIRIWNKNPGSAPLVLQGIVVKWLNSRFCNVTVLVGYSKTLLIKT